MRDPDRIDPMLAGLGALWKRYPDMRLGQLVVNLARDDAATFYVEDDVMAEQIEHPWWERKGRMEILIEEDR
jgi:hypothetical protein